MIVEIGQMSRARVTLNMTRAFGTMEVVSTFASQQKMVTRVHVIQVLNSLEIQAVTVRSFILLAVKIFTLCVENKLVIKLTFRYET